MDRLQYQKYVEANWQKIFAITLAGDDGLVRLSDNVANRQILWRWAEEETTAINDVVAWFKDAMKSPQARAQLSFEPYLTEPQKKQQQAENQKKLRQQFEVTAKTHGLKISDANFNIWQSVPEPVISWFNSKPVIILEDGTTLELVPATEAEKQAWFDQAQQEVFDRKQAKLREMRDSNDLVGLRAAAKAEREEQQAPQAIATVQQERIYTELRNQYARDSQAGFWEPLPKEFTKRVIYTWNAAAMREKIGRYGASRITARIHELTTIPDGNGGTINFEEKR